MFNAGSYDWRIGKYEGNGLALHVRTHKSAVGVVMLKERDKSRGDRDYLLRRNIHIVKLIRCYLYCIVVVSDVDAGTCSRRKDITLVIDGSIRAADIVFVFIVGREIDYLVRNPSVHNLAARADEEAVFVYTCKCRKRRNKADVRAFRGFYRADAAVVSMVNVAGFKSCAFTAQTSGAECRKTASVCKLRKGVCLVHKL